MKVTKRDFELAVANVSAALNYAGQDGALANQSGGDMEVHNVMRKGKKIAVAVADHATGVYEIADDILEKVLPSRVL